MEFSSLEQRMAHSYLDTLPPFVPAGEGPPEAEQRQLYDFVAALYQLVFEDPALLVPQLHADDAFPTRFKKAYGKPELSTNMRKFTREMDSLLQKMFLQASGGEARFGKRQRAVLKQLGLSEDSPLPTAGVWMATRPGASPAKFSHCAFDDGYNYAGDIYARLLGDEKAYRRLEGWLLKQGYSWYSGLDVTASDDRFSLTYANPAWGAGPPRGGFEYGIKHTGISALYEAFTHKPAVVGLCIPGGMKRNLQLFGQMEAPLQRFVAERTKHCDNCGYCVQTDKTGKRPLACLPVVFEGERHSLCSYFPGYSYSWTALDEELVDNLIAFLTFMDTHRTVT